MEPGAWLIVLIVGIVAMVFGPVMMLQPNASQRRQEKLRSHALQQGFRVAMRPLPIRVGEREAGSLMPVYTRLKNRDEEDFGSWLLVRSSYRHESHFHDIWEWQGKKKAGEADLAWLSGIIQQVPEAVLAIGASPQGVHWYWTESGGEAGLQQLQSLSAQLPS